MEGKFLEERTSDLVIRGEYCSYRVLQSSEASAVVIRAVFRTQSNILDGKSFLRK